MRSINLVLLAGISPLAFFSLESGQAVAGPNDGEIVFDTSQSDGGFSGHAGASYSSDVLTINGTVTSATTGNEGLNIYGDGSVISNLEVNVTGSLTGAAGVREDEVNAGSGIVIENDESAFRKNITINNSGTISGAAGTSSYISGAGVDAFTGGSLTINNTGIINGGSQDTTAFSFGPRAIAFDAAEEEPLTPFTLNNDGGTINGDIWTSLYGDQLNFDGGTLDGNIIGTASSASEVGGTGADVYFRSGTTTVSGDIGKPLGTSATVQDFTVYWGPVNTLTVADGGTVRFLNDSNIYAGDIGFSNSGSLDAGSHKITIHDYFDQLEPGSEPTTGTLYYRTTINATEGKHGYFVYTPGISMSDTTMLDYQSQIVPTVVGNIQTGNKYVVIQDTNGREAIQLPSVLNSGGYTWTVSQVEGTGQSDTDGVELLSGSNNILITADRLNSAGSASGTNGAGVRALATYSGDNAGLLALSQAVNDLSSDTEVRRAGAQLRPETTANTAQASLGAVTQALGTIQVRTEAVRTAAAQTGVSSGEALDGLGIWGQAFGSTADQNRRNGIDGYDADTYGLAFGGDFKVLDPVRIGLSFAYANTNVDATGDRDGSGQNIDSYITSLYGSYAGTGWYLDGSLTWGIHKYDNTRAVTSLTPAQTLTANYSGRQLGARIEAGVPLAAGPATVTPLASLAWNNLKQDGYSETGGSAALDVGSSTSNSVQSGLGAKATATVGSLGDWQVQPNIRAVWLHEFNKSAPSQTSAFSAGGASFTTPGSDVATEHFNLGLGLDLASADNTTLSLQYNADLADKYISHSGWLQIRTEF